MNDHFTVFCDLALVRALYPAKFHLLKHHNAVLGLNSAIWSLCLGISQSTARFGELLDHLECEIVQITKYLSGVLYPN